MSNKLVKENNTDIGGMDGSNAPLEHKIFNVYVDWIPAGISDCDELEGAFRALNELAQASGRVVTSVQVQSVSVMEAPAREKHPDSDNDEIEKSVSILYTVMAQWIGVETLKRLNREQQLMTMAPTPGGNPLRSM